MHEPREGSDAPKAISGGRHVPHRTPCDEERRPVGTQPPGVFQRPVSHARGLKRMGVVQMVANTATATATEFREVDHFGACQSHSATTSPPLQWKHCRLWTRSEVLKGQCTVPICTLVVHGTEALLCRTVGKWGPCTFAPCCRPAWGRWSSPFPARVRVLCGAVRFEPSGQDGGRPIANCVRCWH